MRDGNIANGYHHSTSNIDLEHTYPERHLQPSDGARLGVADLSSIPMDPITEQHMPNACSATLVPAYTGPKHLLTVFASPTFPKPPPIWLLAKDDAAQAYAVIESMSPIEITHRHPHWAKVFFAVVYHRVGINTFQAPCTPNYVAIKRLNKAVVHEYLALGGPENPYKEVARMEELGDNIHVLKCVQFLEDKDYLYIVTPRGEQTLKDAIAWYDSDDLFDAEHAHFIFCKILQILGYLERHGINHHDLSPDNFLFLASDNLVVFDLAMSVRIPISPQTGNRTLITTQVICGTYPCMAPEIYAGQHFDGVATDLWSAAVILYYLLTNQLLYREPTLMDLSYRYFVHAKGLSSEPMNQRTIDILQRLGAHSNDERYRTLQQQLVQQAAGHLNLSDEAVHLLELMLEIDPHKRYTLAQTMESTFVQRHR